MTVTAGHRHTFRSLRPQASHGYNAQTLAKIITNNNNKYRQLAERKEESGALSHLPEKLTKEEYLGVISRDVNCRQQVYAYQSKHSLLLKWGILKVL